MGGDMSAEFLIFFAFNTKLLMDRGLEIGDMGAGGASSGRGIAPTPGRASHFSGPGPFAEGI